jgi:hypothetical protein
MPALAVTLVVPCKVALPRVRAALTAVLLSLDRKFPNASSIRTCGEGEKTTPAIAVLAGWADIVSRLAAAGLTVMLDEVALAKLPLLNCIVMLVANV